MTNHGFDVAHAGASTSAVLAGLPYLATVPKRIGEIARRVREAIRGKAVDEVAGGASNAAAFAARL